ncbi:DUF4493 domain-containing protein [uncultured Bacteroides sp.]|uniref:DUF4493 domain-containing protein n=1 Tax=uncultured Bacteroides sp. TaxID=162156 RepID=UPI00259416A8|nr:DUF4493 domain-containing protein [uncultured Bacteroides sp.]
MKKIYLFLFVILSTLSITSCQQDDLNDNIGYLRIEVGTNAYVDTRIASDYNPKQIALQILDSKGGIVESTDDWETLSGQQIRLAAGTYTVKASSNGFDGSESGFDIPYYAGSQQITVQTGKEVTANITCTLANVKVTVNYDQSFIDAFQSATATVKSAMEGVNELSFRMGDELKPAYFPVADLTATISVTNHSGQQFSQDTPITNVKARKHYILNFKVAETGDIGGVSVSVDGTETVYTFTFNVSTEASTKLGAEAANAWSNFAYLEGSILSSSEELDPASMHFEYKKADAEEWQTTSANYNSGSQKFTATLTGLTPATQYTYRLAYEKSGEAYASDPVTFTTEEATTLPNGNMDDWYKSGKTWYPVSESDYSTSGSFWDSSNPGTTTGAGALVNVNPTQGNNSIVHTSGGKSAELKSQYASAFGIGKFAAASLYSGKFNSLVGTNGAKIDFGQKFASRPTGLHGWFRYTSGKIDYRGDNTPAGLGEKGTDDLCSIYMALAKAPHQLNNTDTSTFFDFENDDNIIAYGELPDAEAVSTNNEWKEFNVELKYKDITPQTAYYLIIVCSSSKYGDYFTGSTGSIMYIDDLELLYGVPSTK